MQDFLRVAFSRNRWCRLSTCSSLMHTASTHVASQDGSTLFAEATADNRAQGETLLIRGGTTSVGLAAAAIAKNFGAASVAATSRKAGKEELMKASGVDRVRPSKRNESVPTRFLTLMALNNYRRT